MAKVEAALRLLPGQRQFTTALPAGSARQHEGKGARARLSRVRGPPDRRAARVAGHRLFLGDLLGDFALLAA